MSNFSKKTLSEFDAAWKRVNKVSAELEEFSVGELAKKAKTSMSIAYTFVRTACVSLGYRSHTPKYATVQIFKRRNKDEYVANPNGGRTGTGNFGSLPRSSRIEASDFAKRATGLAEDDGKRDPC